MLGGGPAESGQPLEDAWKSCARATERTERSAGIPKGLLTAISLSESGLWVRERGANVAWPWTVTALGEGRYLATKRDAIDEVLALRDMNVTNIDVGCMQGNLHHHGHAFRDLDEAFDPIANVRYAADYLKRQHASAGDWTRAAGHYHSTTPHLAKRYRAKVVGFWKDTGGLERLALEAADAGDRRRRTGVIDHERTARLNARLRAARAETRLDRNDPAAVRRMQLASWRDARTRLLGTAHLAAKRRARLHAQRLKERAATDGAGRRARFAERRRKDLAFWRTHLRRKADTVVATLPTTPE